MKKRNHNLLFFARQLRGNETPEEKKLWYQFLNQLPVRFRRQETIGNFIVDFCCVKKKLVIELDGSQHYEDDGKAQDRLRDEEISKYGYTVLRYSNYQIHNEFDAVCADIMRYLEE